MKIRDQGTCRNRKVASASARAAVDLVPPNTTDTYLVPGYFHSRALGHWLSRAFLDICFYQTDGLSNFANWPVQVPLEGVDVAKPLDHRPSSRHFALTTTTPTATTQNKRVTIRDQFKDCD